MPDLLTMSRHERFARALGDVQGVMKFSPSSSHRDGIAIFVLEDDAALREDPTYVAARAIRRASVPSRSAPRCEPSSARAPTKRLPISRVGAT